MPSIKQAMQSSWWNVPLLTQGQVQKVPFDHPAPAVQDIRQQMETVVLPIIKH